MDLFCSSCNNQGFDILKKGLKMKRIEFYPVTQTVVIYLDEKVENKIEAYDLARKMIMKEVMRYESNPNYDPDR